MSDPLATNHLGLPYIAPAQAQKHVTHNEALRRLDSVVQLAVLDAGLAAPPADPDEGDRYIVAASATGAWAGHDGEVADFVDGAWAFAAPAPGWLAFDLAAQAILAWVEGSWQAAGGFLGSVDRFGVNATADATNRLAVRSNAVLFTDIEAADGGSGDIRFVVNKEADADTASLLFQSGWSGRAEVELAGDSDFVFKVSPDGSAWSEAIRIDKDTGLATILYDNAASGLAADNLQDAIDEIAGGTGGAVSSVFARTGAVAAALHDYDASQVDNDSSVSGATVKDALDAVASAVAGKQDSDADLAALAAVATAGLLARTGSGTAAARTLTAPAAGITIANGDGAAGNPTLALANDLSALEGLASTGIAVRSASDTWVQRSIAAATGLSVANGSGAAGNPTVALDVNGLAEDGAPDANADFLLTYDASAAAAKKAKPASLMRERLTADRTYYVRTDGSDGNDGLANNSGGAFLTLQHAYDAIRANLDFAGRAVSVQIGDGTYAPASGVNALLVAGPWSGGGALTVKGNAGTPANVVLACTAADVIRVTGVLPGALTVKDLKLTAATSGSGIYHDAPGTVFYANLNFGALATIGVLANGPGALIECSGNYSISGAVGLAHLLANLGGAIRCTGKTITLTGTPAIGNFAYATRVSNIEADSNTFSGSATGTRYHVDTNGVIYTSGGGANYFPGNAAGSAATGGQYV